MPSVVFRNSKLEFKCYTPPLDKNYFSTLCILSLVSLKLASWGDILVKLINPPSRWNMKIYKNQTEFPAYNQRIKSRSTDRKWCLNEVFPLKTRFGGGGGCLSEICGIDSRIDGRFGKGRKFFKNGLISSNNEKWPVQPCTFVVDLHLESRKWDYQSKIGYDLEIILPTVEIWRLMKIG